MEGTRPDVGSSRLCANNKVWFVPSSASVSIWTLAYDFLGTDPSGMEKAQFVDAG